MMSGFILLLIGVFRLGFVLNLFSIPLVSGFTTASGFSIMTSQFKTFFGLPDAPNKPPAVFVKQVANVFQQWDKIKVMDVAFGSACAAFLLIMQYSPEWITMIFNRRNKARSSKPSPSSDDVDEDIPLTRSQSVFLEYYKLFAASRNVVCFVATTLTAFLLCMQDKSFETAITLVGYIKPGLPMPEFPKMSIYGEVVTEINGTNVTESKLLRSTGEIFSDLSVSFAIVPMMILMEMTAITKSLARKNGYRVDATNELMAIGIGNICQSFFQAMPSTAAVTRAALNDQCKVKTQIGSIISATIVIIAISALTETFYYIPKAALAAIIITAAHNLINFSIIISIYREYWPDLVIFFLTFTLCLFFDMAYGILICLLSTFQVHF